MHDLTQGRPLRVILAFTWPLIIGSFFQLAYNFADSMIVGHTLGETAFAAVGATGSLTFFILGFAQGMTSGFSVLLAQRFGAKNEPGIKTSFVTGLALSILISLILTVFSLFFLKDLLHLLQTPDELIDLSHQFLVMIFCGTTATVLYNYLSNSIRALGDSRTPLYALIIAAILNVILDFVFILTFKWGVSGAAFATVLAQIFSVIYLTIHIKRQVPLLQIRRKDWHLDGTVVREHLNLGLPMGFQASIIAIGTMILQFALNQLGTSAIAAQAIASRTDQLGMSPLVNLGQAISTFSAQNYGAKKFDRLFEGLKKSLWISVLWALVFAFLLLAGNRFFSGLFLPDGSPEIYDLALTYFIINGLCYWILAILFITRGFIQGLGKSVTPTLAGIMELVMRGLVAMIGLKLVGFAGVAAAHPAAWIGSVLILIPATNTILKQLRKQQASIHQQ